MKTLSLLLMVAAKPVPASGTAKLPKLYRLGRSAEAVLGATEDGGDDMAGAASTAYNGILAEVATTLDGEFADEAAAWCKPLEGKPSLAEVRIALQALDGFLSGVLVTDVAEQQIAAAAAQMPADMRARAAAMGFKALAADEEDTDEEDTDEEPTGHTGGALAAASGFAGYL
ncbi:MAG: hypothetical protein GY882_07365 [Actinomycetia bacterium]|nr:hypothetical protein [Actinomycetes bacterium]